MWKTVNARRAEILLRRQSLLVRVAVQRQELTRFTRPWEQPIQMIDTAIAGWQLLRAHPVLLALAGGVLAVRRRNLKGLMKAAWSMWGIYRLFIRSGQARGETD
jgi:hypothetical protein